MTEFETKSLALLERIAKVAEGRAASSSRPASGGGLTLPNYGRRKGEAIEGSPLADLEFYANGCRRSLADPEKARWHEKEQALLTAIEAEIDRQSGGGGPPD